MAGTSQQKQIFQGSPARYKAPQFAGNNAHNNDLDLRDILRVIWRRRYLIIGLHLLIIGLTFFTLSLIQSKYLAETILIYKSADQTSDIQLFLKNNFAGRFSSDPAVVNNEIQIITSRQLVKRVVQEYNLYKDPEFNPYLKKPPLFSNSSQQSENGFKSLNLGGENKTATQSGQQENQAIVEATINSFLNKLQVRAVPGASAIKIAFTSNDPEKAALLANSLADTFIEFKLEQKLNRTQKVTQWLDNRLDTLKTQVLEAERAVADYKAANNLNVGLRSTISSEELSSLNASLVRARADLAQLRAELQQVRTLSKNPEKIDTISDIISSTFIQRLKTEKLELTNTLSDLLERYGPKFPEVVRTRAELVNIDKAMSEEMNKIIQAKINEVQTANARVKSLEESLGEVQGQQNQDNVAMVQLQELQREAESSQVIYNTFLEAYKRTVDKEKLEEADIEVLSRAVPPLEPYFPNKPLLLSLSIVFALFLGLAISFLLEKLHNSFKSALQLEEAFGYPCFGLVPLVRAKTIKEVANHILSDPSSIASETIRTLRAVIRMRGSNKPKDGSDMPQPSKVIMMTSSFPGEGKTTLSVWMGRAAAKSGERVLVVDCDLRRPSLHRNTGASNELNIVDYLTGKKQLKEVISTDDPSGAHMIYASSVPNSALDLICHERMDKMVEALREIYDLIILDSPASLAVSDARVLQRLADQTLYAVAWDKTPREIVAGGVKQFYDMNVENLAFVLTGVDIKKHIKQGFGDTIYYYGRYRENLAT